MSEIQDARDVLAKWRDVERNSESWRVEPAGGFATVRDDQNGEVARAVLGDDATLIVGTAGNPDLLDAIDFLLRAYDGYSPHHHARMNVDPLAAAIIAADERMRS